MFRIKSQLHLDNLKDFNEDMKAFLRQLVLDTAKEGVRAMKQNCPIDTGALQASIYYVSRQHNGYNRAVANASSLRYGIKPEPAPKMPNSDYLSGIGIAFPYWKYVTYPTVKYPARPFVQIGIARAEQFFMSQLSDHIMDAIRKSKRRVVEETND